MSELVDIDWNKKRAEFQKALEQLINYHSMESDSNTPDFILAQYLMESLETFGRITNQRQNWFKPPVPVREPPPKRKPRETATEQAIRVEDELMREWKKEHQIEPPKPDPFEESKHGPFYGHPFEEWWQREGRDQCGYAGFGIAAVKAGWDAAIKYAAGQK